MKNKLFALLMCMLPLSLLSAKNNVTDTTACKAWIVDAYRKWMKNEDPSWYKKMLTPEMNEKRRRVECAIDVDPVVRYQGYTDYMLESLTCRHLGGNWFEVSRADDATQKPMRIPVRVEQHGTNDYRINYIAPIPEEEWRGENLFDIKTCEVNAQGSALEFVRSFYCRYTYLYATMVPDLAQQLAEMRQTHCTKAAKQQLSDLENKMGGMFLNAYDALVCYSDFDIYWFRSLKVEPLTDTTFEVSYHISDIYVEKWTVNVVKEEGEWKIEELGMRNEG